MDEIWQSLRIHADRFRADFEQLSQIGSSGDGGVNRPSLSPADLQARAWLREKIEAAGLHYSIDPAVNQSGLLECGPQGAAHLLLGSHLDSVISGGRFDGALGVMAALEVVRTVQEAGLRLPFHLEVVNWTDEEGTLMGFLGSRAACGEMTQEMLEQPKIGRDSLQERLQAAGSGVDRVLLARRIPGSISGYLELHIEQGPRLELANRQIGIVTSIVGITAYRLAYVGRSDHAGTTPMNARLDAGLGAGAFLPAVREMVMRDFPDCVVNIGQMAFHPGAYNIVPNRAELGVEFRSADANQLALLEMAVLKIARAQADRYGLLLESQYLFTDPPAVMSAAAREAIRSAGENLGLSTATLASGAGHDAQILSRVCPAGMIFVPSVDGASHAAREFTRDVDCINGANVLLQAALRLAV